MTASIAVQMKGRVAEIRLNRPERLNALDPDMAAALRSTIKKLASREDVRCVCIAGSGPAFMAGGDLSYFKQLQPQLAEGDHSRLDPVFRDIHDTIATLRTMPQPVIARVHGAVAGFGMSLMLSCDLAMAAAGTSFTLAYCGIGISPDGGATYALPRLVGTRRAMELALLSERFSAARALEMGLVNWVVGDEELKAKCDVLSQRLAQGPALAQANTKSLINHSLDNTLSEQLESERERFLDCAMDEDFEEGVGAFLEKRKPNFGQ